MKLLFAVVSLWAVAVFALQGERARYRFSEVDERDVEPFRSGQTYKYRLDSQISSGMASVSEQHAVTRLQAEALFHFQSERLVSLKLNDVIVGTTNQEVREYKHKTFYISKFPDPRARKGPTHGNVQGKPNQIGRSPPFGAPMHLRLRRWSR